LAKLAHDQADHSIQEFDRSPEANTFWLAVLRASSKLHREWMQIRMQFPTVLADPKLYLASLPHFPDPPVHQSNRGLMFRGTSQGDLVAFRQWFMFEHFQRQLLFSTSLPCPATLIHPHKCPGDPLKKWWWAPNDHCSFAHVMDLLGVREVKVESA